MNKYTRKVTLEWDEGSPEFFGIEYIAQDGSSRSKSFSRFEGETVGDFLKRIGRTCISAAKGDLT